MSPPTTKRCNKCGDHKPVDDFHKDKYGTLGRQGRCKECCSAHTKKFRKENPERAAAIIRKSRLKRQYGLTPDAFDELWADQNGLCAICSTALSRQSNSFAVDHNHHTDLVRSILCRQCNVGLGMFKDSPAILDAASAYLRSYGHYGPQATEGAPAPS